MGGWPMTWTKRSKNAERDSAASESSAFTVQGRAARGSAPARIQNIELLDSRVRGNDELIGASLNDQEDIMNTGNVYHGSCFCGAGDAKGPVSSEIRISRFSMRGLPGIRNNHRPFILEVDRLEGRQ